MGDPKRSLSKTKVLILLSNLLMKELIPGHSCPVQIVSDNATENVKQVMAETLKEMNIDR